MSGTPHIMTCAALSLLCASLLHLDCQAARADIYRYTNDEGIECFTDAPLQSGATRIMADRPKPARVTKRNVPDHLQATGIVKKQATTRHPPPEARRPRRQSFPCKGG